VIPADIKSGIVAIVPVKRLEVAKSRLAARLAPAERARLGVWLLERVLSAPRTSGRVDQALVVSADPAIREIATAVGARTVDEPNSVASVDDRLRHNLALERARERAREWQPRGLLVVSADLPLIEAKDVRALLALGLDDHTVVVAPDRRGRGTNALFLRPPEAIPFRFGPDSYEEHRREARSRGCHVASYRSRGTAFDLDEPGDLEELGFLHTSDEVSPG